MPSTSDQQLHLATVAAVNSSGVRIQLDGQDSAGEKYYKQVINGASLSVGDRVLLAKLSGTCVVLGKIALS